MNITPKLAVGQHSMHLVHAADCVLDGWRLQVSPKHKHVMNESGEIDELMFQAYLLSQV